MLGFLFAALRFICLLLSFCHLVNKDHILPNGNEVNRWVLTKRPIYWEHVMIWSPVLICRDKCNRWSGICLRLIALNQGNFNLPFPRAMSRGIWGFLQLEGCWFLSDRQRSGILLNILQCPGQPLSSRIIRLKMSIMLRVRKPASEKLTNRVHAWGWVVWGLGRGGTRASCLLSKGLKKTKRRDYFYNLSWPKMKWFYQV